MLMEVLGHCLLFVNVVVYFIFILTPSKLLRDEIESKLSFFLSRSVLI